MKEYTVYGIYSKDGSIYTNKIRAEDPAEAARIAKFRSELSGYPLRPLLVFTGLVKEMWREGQ